MEVKSRVPRLEELAMDTRYVIVSPAVFLAIVPLREFQLHGIWLTFLDFILKSVVGEVLH